MTTRPIVRLLAATRLLAQSSHATSPALAQQVDPVFMPPLVGPLDILPPPTASSEHEVSRAAGYTGAFGATRVKHRPATKKSKRQMAKASRRKNRP